MIDPNLVDYKTEDEDDRNAVTGPPAKLNL
jgi:hypothetical protein